MNKQGYSIVAQILPVVRVRERKTIEKLGIMKSWKYLVSAIALVLAVGTYTVPAMATLLTCTEGGVTFSLAPASRMACFSGNDTKTIDSGSTLFGDTGWILADKSDSSTDGDQIIYFTNAPVSGESSTTWTLNLTSLGSLDVMVTLKQASGFAAFLISDTSGTWSTWKSKKGEKRALNGLSHASIYYRSPNSPRSGALTTPVPGPGATTLLLLGLVLLGMGTLLRYRRS